MKILHFVYSLGQGGAERFVIDLVNEQSQKNVVKLYALRDDSVNNLGFFVNEIGEKVQYTNLKITPGFKLQLFSKFNKILKAEKPDVVHCHLDLVNYFFPLSILHRKQIKFVYTIHSHAVAEVKSDLEKVIRCFFFRYKFFIPVAISDETKVTSADYYKLKDIKVIYNGRKFSGKTKDYGKVLSEIESLKSAKDSLVFCHLARYDKLKNQKMLINVFNKLRMEGENLLLLIIGNGFDKDPELKISAGDHIHFLGAKWNVMDYLSASDAFCLSSLSEGMPISLIEALACGCIPVCTPVGGIVNTIEHGVTGFLSRSVSEEDYLEAVREFIINKNNIDRKRLINYYHNNFSIEQCSNKYMKIYQEV
jgi:glycosyltransferase involved in cell wall biosynthesis